MELVKVNALDFQAAQTHLDALTQVFRTGHRRPLVWSLAREAALGGDDQTLRIRMERFSNQVLTDFRTIRVSGINKVDVQIKQALQNALALCGIFRVTPDTLAGDAHCAVTQAIDGEIACNGNSAAVGCIRCSHNQLRFGRQTEGFQNIEVCPTARRGCASAHWLLKKNGLNRTKVPSRP